MDISNYFAICLLAFHQFQSGQSEVVDRSEVVDKPSIVNKPGVASRHRIVNGDLVSPGELKYLVATRHDDRYYLCGGGIIDNYTILSAAHCFIDGQNQFNNERITVVANVTNIYLESDPNRIEVEVAKVYTHKGYRRVNLANDIAILKLKESLNIEKNHLEKLLLPTITANMANRVALIAGFGNDKLRKFFNESTHQWEAVGSASGLLRKANILLFSNDECQKYYRGNGIYDYNICGKMIKTDQEEEYGICNGDSGGPLVLNSAGSKVVIGLVSWSYGCDERKRPTVYTRVSSFLDFIEEARNNITKNANVKVFGA